MWVDQDEHAPPPVAFRDKREQEVASRAHDGGIVK